MRDNRSGGFSGQIPLIDRALINPLDPISYPTAVARSEGQGRRAVFRMTLLSASDARPENLGRRRSLALDRREHDGRLCAVGETGRRDVSRAIIALPIALALTASLPCMASADPPASERFARQLAVFIPPYPYAGFVAEAAKRFDIPERWIRAVMQVESRDDPSAISPKGAMGLMQIMPATWTELRARHHLGEDVFEPRDNILAGAAYLSELHEFYGSPGFLAAYNAGPGRYEKHLVTGDPLPQETIDYVAKLVPMIDKGAAPIVRIAALSERGEWTKSPLFFVQQGDVDGDESSLDGRRPKRSADEAPIVDLSALAPASSGLFVRRAPGEGREQ
ncbi:lytic transglycosylase domain-containing protein [Rhizobium leguminosarum]|uniref:lytic transglycosylase domain-containing protein n=1 Tax=Rhizobium leguminosarum TaxID=384 RepID=UPI00143FA88F|nr:lytic transglycosylase domain-containing protein [Rhizobium leguminosarum]MBY5841312.1 lytic transglycosylase domain-containing protein [Rhizobium leguminosarum]NKM65701.1 transglycosylase SLT domain-containing protein [Rhizobium leguminosarum bv. viciae]NKM80929.1 transglycosylase SLT domain-containing protein [Rhizobium leguminosarum bv. viciae]QSZ07295.1 lytic transglycosylase domain-containing protein [Rhizobium leguminosarum]